MAIKPILIDQLIQKLHTYIIIDVRSPSEYTHAHIPLAYNISLFDDSERQVVGTVYKQKSKQEAIKIGLSFFSPKMLPIVTEVENILCKHADVKKEIVVYCWRGGMRSAAISWLLDIYGFTVYTVVGGYKNFRRWVLQQFEIDYPLCVLGGFTGSNKTNVLYALEAKGEYIIDLEKIASHRGSAFGSLGMDPQPTQEMFENNLAMLLYAYKGSHCCRIWIEDESQRIGKINIPTILYRSMRNKPLFFLEVPFDIRLQRIIALYGQFSTIALEEAITRIQKRLGGKEKSIALEYLYQKNTKECFSILLKYYDKWYLLGMQKRLYLDQCLHKIPINDNITPIDMAMLLMKNEVINKMV